MLKLRKKNLKTYHLTFNLDYILKKEKMYPLKLKITLTRSPTKMYLFTIHSVLKQSFVLIKVMILNVYIHMYDS